MAAVTGTVHSVSVIQGDAVSRVQAALVLFTLAGTYVQADNGILAGVATLIQNSTRNGKTVTVLGATPGQTATKSATPGEFMGLKTVAVSGADLTFEVTDNSDSTEHAGAAMTAHSRPFGLIVSYVET